MPAIRKRMALNENKPTQATKKEVAPKTEPDAAKKLKDEEQIAPIVKAFAAAARMPAIKKRMALNENKPTEATKKEVAPKTETDAVKKLKDEEQIAPIVKAFAAAAHMPAIRK